MLIRLNSGPAGSLFSGSSLVVLFSDTRGELAARAAGLPVETVNGKVRARVDLGKAKGAAQGFVDEVVLDLPTPWALFGAVALILVLVAWLAGKI